MYSEETQARADYLVNRVLSGKLYDSVVSLGHMEERHVGLSPVQLLDSFLQTDRPYRYTNAFQNKETAQYDIEDAIMRQSQEIAAWLNDEHESEHGNRCELTLTMNDPNDEDPVYLQGTAFRQTPDDISLCASTDLHCVLEKTQGSPEGFAVVTAFPITNKALDDQTENDIRSILHKTQAYQTADPVHKAFLDYQAKQKPETRPLIRENKDRTLIQIACPEYTEDARLKINQKGIVLAEGHGTSYQERRVDKLTQQEIPEAYELAQQFAKEIQKHAQTAPHRPMHGLDLQRRAKPANKPAPTPAKTPIKPKPVQHVVTWDLPAPPEPKQNYYGS